jgi:hypothetical protein
VAEDMPSASGRVEEEHFVEYVIVAMKANAHGHDFDPSDAR